MAVTGNRVATADAPPPRVRAVGPWRAALVQGRTTLKVLAADRSATIGMAVLAVFVLVAVFAPWLAPYGPFEVTYGADAVVARLSPPSVSNPFGTTNQGMDVFSQLIWGTRVALVVGLVSGYFGGWIDDVLMRMTDVAFGIPFLPFAMVVISIARPSLSLSVVLVVFCLWRTTARVIRSQVLSLKERPFVWAARAAGASDLKILFRHVAPNALPLSFLYMAIGVQTAVMLEAGLSFLGFGDPQVQSWGIMLNAAFRAGAMRSAWWWVLPPGLALSAFVMAIFMVTRAYEEVLNPRLRKA